MGVDFKFFYTCVSLSDCITLGCIAMDSLVNCNEVKPGSGPRAARQKTSGFKAAGCGVLGK